MYYQTTIGLLVAFKGITACDDTPCLSLVTKQILIHQMPQILILHFKRFNLDTYMVTKETKHVEFSPILNMAPYCSNMCLEVCKLYFCLL